MDKAGGMGAGSLKGSDKSKASFQSRLSALKSQKSKMSRMSMGLKNRTTGMENTAEAIPEDDAEHEPVIEAKPEDFVVCSIDGRMLS